MKAVVVLEQRFAQTPDGAVWTQVAFDNTFWQRYLEVFDSVRIVARAKQVQSITPDWKRVDGDNVELAAVPHYIGPGEFCRKMLAVRRAVHAAVGTRDAVILRVSSQLANCLMPKLKRDRHPFGVEVVADPWNVFSPGASHHPLRAYFRRYFAASLREQCQRASAAAYVTSSALQKRYPPSPDVYSIGCSDVELPDEAFHEHPREFASGAPLRLLTVGNLDQMYKGVDVLIDALAACLREGCDVRLTIVGEGKHRAELEQRAAAAGCQAEVEFVGLLTAGEAVRRQLDRADIFVLASRQEGLPRAMVEAMARALPCIGTSVGGIPELLPAEDRVDANSVAQLADKICEVTSNRDRLRRMSARNLKLASQYHDRQLHDLRIEYYEAVRDAMQAHLGGFSGSSHRSRRDRPGATPVGARETQRPSTAVSPSVYARFVKRVLDATAAAALLVVLGPVMALVGVLLLVANRGQVFFIQQRPGQYGRPFQLFKFKTMNDARDANGQLLPDDERLTVVGRLLRATSLDELPQLVNVLRGEMSLVGPRPLLMRYLDRYTPQQARRHDVKPGITGWAQVNGRNAITWEEKFALDLQYVRQCSFRFDIKILFLTLWKLVRSEGITAPVGAAAAEFQGTDRAFDRSSTTC